MSLQNAAGSSWTGKLFLWNIFAGSNWFQIGGLTWLVNSTFNCFVKKALKIEERRGSNTQLIIATKYTCMLRLVYSTSRKESYHISLYFSPYLIRLLFPYLTRPFMLYSNFIFVICSLHSYCCNFQLLRLWITWITGMTDIGNFLPKYAYLSSIVPAVHYSK